MAIEKGDFIKFNFIGRIESTGEVYNTTIEEIAHEAGIYNEKSVYKPMPVVLGQTLLFPELTEAIEGSEIGDKMTVKVPYEHAFGPRDPSLIKLMHIKEFKKQGINPVPGLIVQNEDGRGKILTVNGGRVKVDFNDEFAGKDLICDVEVCEIIEDDDDKVKALIELNYSNQSFDFDKTKLEWNDNVLNIILDPAARFDQDTCMNITLKKFQIANAIYTSFENITKVNFIDEFEKPEEKVPQEESGETTVEKAEEEVSQKESTEESEE